MASKISVALASCNGGAFIGQQLESILQQTLVPDEIVVSDDNSTDDTLAVLRRYEQSGIVKVYPNDRRIGIIDNFRRAVAHCRPGNYIALSDQDDVWLPQKLRRNMETMPGADAALLPAMVFSDLSMVDVELNEINNSFWGVLNVRPEMETLESLLFGNIVTGCTVMMNPVMAALFTGMPGSGVSMHDAWLGLIAFSFGRYAFSPEPLVLYRQHGGNATFATNRSAGIGRRIKAALGQLLDNKAYFRQEISMARAFRDAYGGQLSAADKATVDRFIALEHASFITKKRSSMAARAYRISDKH